MPSGPSPDPKKPGRQGVGSAGAARGPASTQGWGEQLPCPWGAGPRVSSGVSDCLTLVLSGMSLLRIPCLRSPEQPGKSLLSP